ncbi:hypothetical protein U9M48_034635 [Paspalum notatum var. saurae]|uniref:2-isopropylmalate synthase n=1 Tax=Paspalum notatum var. saurae TaxID=547442 RepID=A0AAQ3UDW7_PASNO
MAMASSLLSSPAKAKPTVRLTVPPPFRRHVSIRATTRACASTSSSQHRPPPPRRRRPEYRIADPGYVRVLDTTLRDGEQSPGGATARAQKLAVEHLGVDVTEAGFPASSPADLAAVSSIAAEAGEDVGAAWEAVRGARRPRVHAFVATSGVHMRRKLRNTPEEAVAVARETVAYARRLGCHDVEFFSPEHAGSGGHALGYEIGDKEFQDFFKRYKEVAEKKKRVTDEDIEALLSGDIFQPVIWSLADVQATCGTLGLSTATVKLTAPGGQEKIACSVGTGPVDAAYKAVDQIIQIPIVLREYSMTSVTEGIDAIATTRVAITGDVNTTKHGSTTGQYFSRTFSGSGAAMDIVVSSVRAYLSAVNKMCSFAGAVKASRDRGA